MSNNEYLTAKFDGLAVGGIAVGVVEAGAEEHLGKRVFVRNAVPGDLLIVEPSKIKKNFIEADIVSVKEPSNLRVQAPCSVAERCGGCDLQFVTEVEHTSLKWDMIAKMMQARGLDASKLSTFPKAPLFGTRRRTRLRFNEYGAFGFLQRKTAEIVSIDDCMQLSPELREIIPGLKGVFEKLGLSGSIVLESDGKKCVAIVNFKDKPLDEKVDWLIAELRAFVGGGRVEREGKVIKSFGQQQVFLSFEGTEKKLPLEPGSFSQVNQKVNSDLVNYVMEKVKSAGGSTCWDLYSGAGNFAFPLALEGYKVTAVEGDARLVRAAQKYAKANELPVKFVKSSVERFVAADNDTPDIIMSDPPRDGLKRVIQKLPKAGMHILVSCHLPSFVRDVQDLAAQGWELQEVVPFDMFPLTNYVELVSVLVNHRYRD